MTLCGDIFIEAAMSLDFACQFDIRHMISGLIEPGRQVTDAVIMQLLTQPRCTFYKLSLLKTNTLSSQCILVQEKVVT